MVETNDTNDVTPVDRARTLIASGPRAIWRTDLPLSCEQTVQKWSLELKHGDIWRMDGAQQWSTIELEL